MANATFSAAGYGSRSLNVIEFEHGISIAATGEGEAKDHRTFFAMRQTSSSFDLTLVFSRWEEKENFVQWLSSYVHAVTRSSNTSVAPMQVTIPSRGIAMVGIPTKGMKFGDKVKQVTYPIELSFVGTSRPQTTASKFLLPQSRESHLFYPGGNQLSGNAEDIIYKTVMKISPDFWVPQDIVSRQTPQQTTAENANEARRLNRRTEVTGPPPAPSSTGSYDRSVGY